jgi:hypothetical protein
VAEFQVNVGFNKTPVEELVGEAKVKPPVVKLKIELQVVPLFVLTFQ